MIRTVTLLIVASLGLAAEIPAAANPIAAGTAFAETPLDRGIAAVVGGDRDLVASLVVGGGLVVHWLPAQGDIEAHRAWLVERGLAGRVVVGGRPGKRLPYGDRFVNLLVRDAPVDDAEADRVVSLRGAQVSRAAGGWVAKPSRRDPRIAGWPQKFFDASGNAVSPDQVAAMPRAVQWQHGPSLDDNTAGGMILRVNDGRAVAVEIGGSLACRDSGNGTFLWSQPTAGLPQNCDLALVGGQVFAFTDLKPVAPKKVVERGLMVAFDLADGHLVRTFDQGVIGGAASKEPPAGGSWMVAGEREIVQARGPDLVVLERSTGAVRWKKTIEGASWFSPTIAEGRVLAAEAVQPGTRQRYDGAEHVRAVAAFDLADGTPRWRTEDVHPEREIPDKKKGPRRARANFKPLAAAYGLVVIHISSYQMGDGARIAVLDATTGKPLWGRDWNDGGLYDNASQRAVLRQAGDRVEAILIEGYGVWRWDARTGTELPRPTNATRPGGRSVRMNGACTASRATVNWLMGNSWNFVGPDGVNQARYAMRGACGQGTVPAEGLAFVLPNPCDCGDYLRGTIAGAPIMPGTPIADADQLERGPGIAAAAAPADWPCLLGSPQRLGSSTSATIPAGLTKRFAVRIAPEPATDAVTSDRQRSERWLGALAAPVAGAGLVVVPGCESGTLVAVDAETGAVRWRQPTPARVDVPPHLAGGLAVYGAADGSVSAVSLTDGRLVWRRHVAPTDGVAALHGHLASPNPVPAALVVGDAVLAVAGLHNDMGGLQAVVLDLASGAVRARRAIVNDIQPVVVNTLPVLADDLGIWLGPQLRLNQELSLTPAKNAKVMGPAASFDRDGYRLRLRPDGGRGGSTHGWGGATRINGVRRFRVAMAGTVIVSADWPIVGRGAKAGSVAAYAISDPKTALWQVAADTLGIGAPSAVVTDGERLAVAGGSLDGRAGGIAVLSVKDGAVLAKAELPARATENGLALGGGRIVVACEDGQVLSFGP